MKHCQPEIRTNHGDSTSNEKKKQPITKQIKQTTERWETYKTEPYTKIILY